MCQSSPSACDYHYRYPSHFQNPIPLKSQNSIANKSVNVVKRSGSNQNKGQDSGRSYESQPCRYWRFSDPDEQDDSNKDAGQSDACDEPQLDSSTLSVPTLVKSDHAA
jgi:hypothetical protein